LFLGGQEYESFVALWLDAQNRLIAGMELFRGTTTQTSVYPREVVRDRFEAQCIGGDLCA
jgi:DNA repair protein RadC